jgi:hypothetical protein
MNSPAMISTTSGRPDSREEQAMHEGWHRHAPEKRGRHGSHGLRQANVRHADRWSFIAGASAQWSARRGQHSRPEILCAPRDRFQRLLGGTLNS